MTTTPDLDAIGKQIDHYLKNLKYRQTGGEYGTKPNGFAYAEIPDWALRQALFGIRAQQQRIAELEAELVRVSEHVNSNAVNELQRLGQEIEQP